MTRPTTRQPPTAPPTMAPVCDLLVASTLGVAVAVDVEEDDDDGIEVELPDTVVVSVAVRNWVPTEDGLGVARAKAPEPVAAYGG